MKPAPLAIAAVNDGVDRRGSDYRSFEARGAAQCAATCAGERQCRAWTWTRPAAPEAQGRCWLKDDAPAPAKSACCISGVKATRPDVARRR